jgi:hypothetical protein
MSARIMPSSISLITPPIIASTPTIATMDSTGDPGTNPSGSGSYPIIVGSPGGSGSGNC